MEAKSLLDHRRMTEWNWATLDLHWLGPNSFLPEYARINFHVLPLFPNHHAREF